MGDGVRGHERGVRGRGTTVRQEGERGGTTPREGGEVAIRHHERGVGVTTAREGHGRWWYDGAREVRGGGTTVRGRVRGEGTKTRGR